MQMLKLNVFSNENFTNDQELSKKFIPEPSFLKKTAHAHNHRVVCVRPSEASRMGLFPQHPVTVRVTGLSWNGAALQVPEQTPPCFVLLTLDYLPKKCAYMYCTAVHRHLLAQHTLMSQVPAPIVSGRVELLPVPLLQPAHSLALKPSFSYGIVNSRYACHGYIKHRMRYTGAATPNPYLVTEGSKLFISDNQFFQVTAVSKDPEDQACEHPVFVLKDDRYICKEHRHCFADTGGSRLDADVLKLNSSITEYNARSREAALHYISEDTQLQFLDIDSNAQWENLDVKEPYFYVLPELDVLIKRISSCARLIKKIGTGRCLSVGSGVLLHGPARSGKTTLLQHAARQLSMNLLEMSLEFEGKKDLVSLFDSARKMTPCIVSIPYADLLTSEELNDGPNPLPAALFEHLHAVKDDRLLIVLVLITCQPEKVCLRLRRAMAGEVYVPMPDLQRRHLIIRDCLQQCHEQQLHRIGCAGPAAASGDGSSFSDGDGSGVEADEWIDDFARATEGCTVVEVLQQLNRKLRRHTPHSPDGLSPSLPSGFVPMAFRQRNRGMVSVTTWADIQGYDTLKADLQRMVSLYREDPVHNPLQGLLLYGPPGCSKTMFVKALVTETGFSYFPLMCSVILSKYVGETEQKLVSLIHQARRAAPSVVFMDELEALCGERAGGGGGGEAPVAELLELMAGCAAAQEDGRANVLFVGATNRPQMLDQGLLQARFLSRCVHVPLPDCAARCSMWQRRLADTPCHGEVDALQLCHATHGHSGAEIEGIYQDACQTVIRGVLSSLHGAPLPEQRAAARLTQEALLGAVQRCPPRTPHALLREVDDFTRSRARASGTLDRE